MTLPSLRLKSNSDRRIKAGHLWVFSNEVDTAQTPLTAFEPGSTVGNRIRQALGLGVHEPNQSDLCAHA